jgi:Uma2 family endonuclease
MADSPTLLEGEHLVIHMRPAIEMDADQFFQFCQLNGDYKIERTADGDLIISGLRGGSTGIRCTKLITAIGNWSELDGTGQTFSCAGFTLTSGAIRSADVAWVRNERLDALTDKEWQKFLPLCPDFVLELRSPSDSLRALQRKMEEYCQNGAQLSWLLEPEAKSVHVYRPDAAPQILENPITVSGEPLLRGFVLDLQEIWAAMERKKC